RPAPRAHPTNSTTRGTPTRAGAQDHTHTQTPTAQPTPHHPATAGKHTHHTQHNTTDTQRSHTTQRRAQHKHAHNTQTNCHNKGKTQWLRHEQEAASGKDYAKK